jgi:calcineurin-like phosphoesterase family protein
MSKTFLISDTHFGHQGSCEFLRKDGVTKMRPWDNAEAMTEAMIDNWNRVVSTQDKVYHLGDVVIARRYLKLVLPRLNGKKVLIKGNHDIFKMADYTPYFTDIRGSHKLDNFILSHIPIHPESLARWCGGNIHGHLHDNVVVVPHILNEEWKPYVPDPRYINVCVEHIDYTPIDFEEIKEKQKGR